MKTVRHREAMATNHDELYRDARVYDVAFSYRDFERELDFLMACARRYGEREPDSFLEVAAGPGVHAIVAAQRGLRAIAFDLSASMVALCVKKADEASVAITAMVADMSSFHIAEPVALAFNPITSIAYMRTLEALCAHMQAMAEALLPGGVYVVESNHPKDFLAKERFEPSMWTMSDGPLTVKTTWLATPPRVDAATQLYEAVARYEISDRSNPALPTERRVEDRAWLRMTLPAELALAARLAGLTPCAVLGDLNLDTQLTDAAWRAVSVFCKPRNL